jgi:hypothetical protein
VIAALMKIVAVLVLFSIDVSPDETAIDASGGVLAFSSF